MCSLHLTHPSAHTLGAVGNQCCGTWGAFGGSVPCSRVMDNSCRSRDSNQQPQVASPTLYSFEPRLPNFLLMQCEEESEEPTQPFVQ